MSLNENIALNIIHLKKRVYKIGPFCFYSTLLIVVPKWNKVWLILVITVADWQFGRSLNTPIENLTFNGVQMKKRIFVLSLVLVGCASTEMPTSIDKLAPSKTGLVELFVEQKANAIELSCSPISEEAGKSVVWVKQCNELAVKFLNDQIKNGIEFQTTINDKPFGMAGDFVGQMLLAHPSNFKAFSLAQTFSLKMNKA